jgi:hypothetical protein
MNQRHRLGSDWWRWSAPRGTSEPPTQRVAKSQQRKIMCSSNLEFVLLALIRKTPKSMTEFIMHP